MKTWADVQDDLVAILRETGEIAIMVGNKPAQDTVLVDPVIYKRLTALATMVEDVWMEVEESNWDAKK